MKVQLYSIEQAPRDVPIWPALLDELCNPPAERVARVLGLSVRQVRRYNRTGRAPRAACLALFWLTRWGRSAVDAQAVRDAQLALSCMRSLAERVAELEGALVRLQALNHSGAANDPLGRLGLPSSPVARLDLKATP